MLHLPTRQLHGNCASSESMYKRRTGCQRACASTLQQSSADALNVRQNNSRAWSEIAAKAQVILRNAQPMQQQDFFCSSIFFPSTRLRSSNIARSLAIWDVGMGRGMKNFKNSQFGLFMDSPWIIHPWII